ncbi:N-acetyltransferase [Candidatus Uhrbacteria bacterium]|nr:N-acetyltransferase [Candidatus Uhrbacteria bacterium]
MYSRESVRQIPSESEFRQVMLQRLERLGMVRHEEGRMIVRVEDLRTGLIKKIRGIAEFASGGRFDSYFEKDSASIFYLTFRDAHIVSEEDWERKGMEAKPKKLFYTPETEDVAFDPQKIRQQDFYLGLWELPNIAAQSKKLSYPSQHEHLQMNEVAIAALMYHPQYGDAMRDAQGRLLVRNKESRAYRPINGEWFEAMGFSGGDPKEGDSMHAPREYVTRHAHNLVQRGLIRADDFRSTSHATDQEQRIDRGHISKSGTIMLHGVIHSIGRRFARESYSVKDLSPGVGGLVERAPNGIEHIKYTFTIFQKGDPRLAGRTVSFGSGQTREYASPDMIDLKEYVGLSTVDERMRSMVNLEVGNKLWEKIPVNYSGLSEDEQTRVTDIVGAMNSVEQATFITFISKFKIEGLRTFLSAEGDAKQGKKIYLLVQELGDPMARTIFRRYNELLNLTRKTTKDLTDQVFESAKDYSLDRAQLNGELIARAKRVLLDFADKARDQKKKHFYAEDLIKNLEHYEEDLILFTSVCKTVGKKQGIKFEELHHVEYISDRLPKELSDQEKDEIKEVLRMNWVDQDKIAAGNFKKALEEKLHINNAKTRFTLLKKDGHVIGFIRFDERPDLGERVLYGGSFNIHPDYRGSSIGNALMKRTIDDKAKKGFVLHAHVVPDAIVGTSYVEDMDHIITGIDETKVDEKGKHAPLLKILRDDQLVLRSRAPGMTRERLMEDRTQGVRVLKFDLRTEKDRFLTTIREASQQGRIVSRYFADPKNPAMRYVAIEADPRSSTYIQTARAGGQ